MLIYVFYCYYYTTNDVVVQSQNPKFFVVKFT